MTIGSFNLEGDLDLAARETDKTKFLANVKKLALQRSVAERTVMLWCYNRSNSPETVERLKTWISEEDRTGRWLMSLPEYELEEG
jgi:hypothetical protein